MPMYSDQRVEITNIPTESPWLKVPICLQESYENRMVVHMAQGRPPEKGNTQDHWKQSTSTGFLVGVWGQMMI